jgi:4-hydroxy-tetrahydrodipicolinate reductase
MGTLTCATVAATPDLELAGRYAPGHGFDDPEALRGSDVVVELTRPEVVMENLRLWRSFGVHTVVGTSGFDEQRLDQLRESWAGGPPNCLIVPNFSVGAVLMMWMAERVAPHFQAAEVVELHHDRKLDAPSGTSIATAGRMVPAGRREVPIHSVRLPGLLAHQEVLMGNPGEVLTIRHDTLDRSAFLPGILLAVRAVARLEPGVTVGLEPLLDL